MNSLTFDVTPTDNPTSAERRAEILAAPGFGRYFTDHMVTIEWSADRGWHDARVRPYGPLTLDPSTSVLHYGQAIFEGLKAYRHADGSIRTFRPEENGVRLQQSAARMAMPELPVELFVESIRQLVDIDRDWVPAAGGEESLYLRPFMIATESTLGVHPSDSYTYAVIASPAGAYFSGGVNPVSVWLCEDFVRACPGGTGAAKFAGNYAASLQAQAQAAEKGCDQVVWLDAIEHSYVEEMGGMNLFFVYGADGATEPGDITVATPALSGSLLPGVTRRSLLQVAKDQGYRTEEFRISTEQWRNDAASGELKEVFACGTAAVITPVGHVKSAQGDFDIADGGSGDITMKLRAILTGIQKGEVEDTHGWLHTLVD
ncbi:branched-chain amino acid aminotransferase [Corynebacterium pygosceleis]|uniref:branched-chain-amino-acid transaminase n=1 Tax=Corynebacterium pygosceleis TaxID=2800406 RepID=A0A9Q4GIR0_9CORY|nr:branched-chain amino acid aminotransferase [Corynebacterium pygosceleis]MCK7636606.1 branched-chain amino acid aminotransferase [Corynebacterium pygosceleis]MCK7675180.1 branched-chain amino acid aminotransferase [Corynebacterium pygosceleis]MCL0120605.1 branched-chain amino acid aminotransferase [Corynebacterium pygosceleis]MCX7444156.1 branched-chain amino acid aminotransferase [Corynebacterium pygosceleis]MCX7467359.1 branched-chain amino acid aminotransferase [Corynebacterium pygoscelei